MTKENIHLYGKSYTPNSICEEKDEFIRLEAANLGFALKQLINDPSSLVRSTIARIKFEHEYLAKDNSWKVRATVAKHCHPKLLKMLINDDNHFVRYIIVKRGYYLDHFIHDQDEEIADLARYLLKKS